MLNYPNPTLGTHSKAYFSLVEADMKQITELSIALMSAAALAGPLPELIFHAPFDGTPDAAVAKGDAKPLRAEGLEYAEGRRGQAVRIAASAHAALEYASARNLVQERGAVSFWFKREWPDRGFGADHRSIWRVMFSNPYPAGGADRVGSGELWFWNNGNELRVDQSDKGDHWHTAPAPFGAVSRWHHFIASWGERGIEMYIDGRRSTGINDNFSPIRQALDDNEGVVTFNRAEFDRFCVGGRGGGEQFDGLIDDLRVYAGPVTAEQARDLYVSDARVDLRVQAPYAVEGRPGRLTVSAKAAEGIDLSGFRYILRDKDGTKTVATFPDAVTSAPARLSFDLPAGEYLLSVTDGKDTFGEMPVEVFSAENPYELSGAEADSAKGGVPAGLELVETFDVDGLPPADRFRTAGETVVKRLGDIPYLEAGPKAGDRFALRFKVDGAAPLYCFEIDYPDDAKRTADLILQRSKVPDGDYAMQVGYAVGGEYPNSGKILTHRALYWNSGDDVSLIVMTANDGEPAAVSAVRVYRVKDSALPPAKIGGDGEHRNFALYFEDPSLGYEFGLDDTGGDPDQLAALIDRTAALMKYTGQDTLAYPGAWYHGLYARDTAYNPRGHAPYFLDAFYSKFDVEGLSFYPTLNVNAMPVPDGLVTRKTLEDGSLHSSVIAIQKSGKANRNWHDSPPGFNFHHPEVRKFITDMIDTLVDQGADHPSFKGVCLHLTRHCLMWYGDEESGYNDYVVDDFAKAEGLTIPVDRADPLRGKAYYEWIRANAWEKWIQWRCDQVTAFYAEIARKLAARRPDLKLWVNNFVPPDLWHPDFPKPEYLLQANRGCGLDGPALTRAAPNVILCQTMVPADYRKIPARTYPTPAALECQRELELRPGFYSLLRGAAFPWVNQHDRYWESAIGGGSSLGCDWLRECYWRVTTVNPGGVHALRHFAAPFRHHDVLGLSKGGFLIGTYGMEDVLVPFVQAFRALPPVVFDDIPAAAGAEDDLVRVRAKAYKGRSYFYAVNTDMKPVSVRLNVPAGTRDLVTGEALAGDAAPADVALDLGPYEFRSFGAPGGDVKRK